MEYLHLDYAKIRQLFFVMPVTMFTIVLFFVNTAFGILCFAILFITVQLTTFITFHQRANYWRDTIDGIIKELFVFLFKVGIKKKTAKSQGLCQKEATKISRLIVKDFVEHWYREYSDDKEFPNDILLLLEHLAAKLEDRCRAINIEELLAEIIPLVTAQLRAVSSSAVVEDNNGVKKLDVQSSDCVRQFETIHLETVHSSLVNYNSEYRHIKNIIDLLLDAVLPVKYKHCEGGRLFVREVLTCRVILPTINQLCNPNFLNQAIVHLFSPANPSRIASVMRQIEAENAELSTMEFHHYSPYMSRTLLRHHREGDNTPRDSGLKASHNWKETSYEVETMYQTAISIVGYKYVQNGGFVGYIVQFPLEVVEGDGGYLRMSSTPSTPMVRALIRYSRFEKLHATLNKPPLSKFLLGVRLPEKKSLSSLLHKVTSWFDDPEFLQERKTGLEVYLKSLWKVNEIRSSGLLRQFLTEGISLYKMHCTNPNEDGDESVNKLLKSSSATALGASQQQGEVVKPKKALQRMLNNYLYVHLPLNTTTLPVLSCNAATDATTTEEATLMQMGDREQPVSMVTASADAGKLPKMRSRSRTSSEDSAASLSMVTASSDRRHFWTDNATVTRRSLDYDASSSNSMETGHALSSSTPASPTFLSSTPPPSDVTFDSMHSDHPISLTTTTPSDFSTPPNTAVTAHCIPMATPNLSKLAAVDSKEKVAGGFMSWIKCSLWKLYQFLLVLFRASFVPVSDRMITLLAKEQETRSPLSNALLCFVTEVTSQTTDKSWLCNERLQLGMLSLFGKQLDRYILDLLLTVTEDEAQWCRAMFHLRNMFWPGGQFDTSVQKQLSEQEREELKQQAVDVLKAFFPAIFAHMVGQEDYDRSLKLCLTCLENSLLNRHLLYKILDVLVAKIVPEVNQPQFTSQLLLHRTRVLNL